MSCATTPGCCDVLPVCSATRRAAVWTSESAGERGRRRRTRCAAGRGRRARRGSGPRRRARDSGDGLAKRARRGRRTRRRRSRGRRACASARTRRLRLRAAAARRCGRARAARPCRSRCRSRPGPAPVSSRCAITAITSGERPRDDRDHVLRARRRPSRGSSPCQRVSLASAGRRPPAVCRNHVAAPQRARRCPGERSG